MQLCTLRLNLSGSSLSLGTRVMHIKSPVRAGCKIKLKCHVNQRSHFIKTKPVFHKIRPNSARPNLTNFKNFFLTR